MLGILARQGRLRRRVAPRRAEKGDRIRFFNPEHLYIFARAYLERRLRESGFAEVRMEPACVLSGRGCRGRSDRPATASSVQRTCSRGTGCAPALRCW